VPAVPGVAVVRAVDAVRLVPRSAGVRTSGDRRARRGPVEVVPVVLTVLRHRALLSCPRQGGQRNRRSAAGVPVRRAWHLAADG